MKNMLAAFIFIIALVFLSMIPTVTAVTVSSIYQAEIPVISQSEDERTQAVKQAFLEVLMKVSGDTQIEKNPVVKSNLRKAAYYVKEFSYASPTTASSHYLLQVQFDKEDIDRLLKKANLPTWGVNRPLILVWLVTKQGEQAAEIVGNETGEVFIEEVQRDGKKSGIPLIFPMMDMTDLAQISAEDVQTKSMPALEMASKRYSPDALLLGSIEHKDGVYQSEWELVLDDNQWTWSISGKTQQEVIASIMNEMSQTLAKRYIVKTDPSATARWLKLEVTNITAREDLARLMQYLKQITSIQQIQLMQVSGDIVKLSILVRGSQAVFEQNAAISRHLVLKEQNKTNDLLIYEWVP